MPDMGLPHDRHDDSRDGAPRPLPRDWREALSALPLDTPDSDGWARLAACLPVAGASAPSDDLRTRQLPGAAAPAHDGRTAPGRSRRLRAWLSLAAVLAAVAAIPLQQRLMSGAADDPPPTPVPSMTSADPTTEQPTSATAPAAPSPATRTPSTVAIGDVPAGGDSPIATVVRPGQGDGRGSRRAADTTTTARDTASRPAPRHEVRVADISTPRHGNGTANPGEASPAGAGIPASGQVDASPAGTAISRREPTDPTDAVAGPDHDELERLYAESARLEALVAIARDDNVASAPAMLLTASLDDRIGRIDGALSQPELDRQQRLQLWRSRVETLHELAGVETTQRWLSARGESWDAALVQVD
ncbi:hypothetical protein [Marilutibacter chinensis]|uniref:Uncharacterized protein n=1 Tax=Marilutibacter chinensis TaxID=2912247 RepID=A0ABS9HWQ1_9GAMM|nr:hypothetical protein [Lysobacter chinensis]MCF7222557.1 hypothetical protein [Lysobacter chinensis]